MKIGKSSGPIELFLQPKSRKNTKNPYIEEMEENVAKTLRISKDQVNIKATTEEHLGFTGREEGISSQAVCLLESFYDASFMAASTERNCAACGGCAK